LLSPGKKTFALQTVHSHPWIHGYSWIMPLGIPKSANWCSCFLCKMV
jgi:hypothetical protein